MLMQAADSLQSCNRRDRGEGKSEKGKEEERGGGENGPPERRNYYSRAQIILHQNLEKL